MLPYTYESIKQSMRDLTCNGYEGHRPHNPPKYIARVNPNPGEFYEVFLCAKCGVGVHVNWQTLELAPDLKASRPTPPYP